MNIEQAPQIALDKRRAQNAHETGKQNQLRLVFIDNAGKRCIKRLTTGETAMIKHTRWNTACGGNGNTRSSRLVADHSGTLARQIGIEQRVHIAAATRDKDDVAFHG